MFVRTYEPNRTSNASDTIAVNLDNSYSVVIHSEQRIHRLAISIPGETSLSRRVTIAVYETREQALQAFADMIEAQSKGCRIWDPHNSD